MLRKIVLKSDADIACPFFVRFSERGLVCEGGVNGQTITHRFKKLSSYLSFRNKFCNSPSSCSSCPYYKIAFGSYDV